MRATQILYTTKLQIDNDLILFEFRTTILHSLLEMH